MPNLSMTSVPFVTAFLPTSVGSLALWLDGTDPAGTGTAPSAGATVSTWVDKSTSGTNISAITAGQTQLLLLQASTGLLTDTANNTTVTNTGTATWNALTPF